MRAMYSATVFLALTFAASPALAQDAASTDPVEAVRGFLTDAERLGAAEATVGSLGDGPDGVSARDVAIRWSLAFELPEGGGAIDAVLTAPEIVVSDLAPAGEGYSASITMPTANLAVTVAGAAGETLSYAVTATDYSFQNASWDAFPQISANPAAPVSRFAPLIDWIAGLSYEENAIGRIDAVVVMDGERQEVSYGPLTLGPVVDGRLESFEYAPLVSRQTSEIPNAEGEPETVEIVVEYGATRGRGVDMKPIAALLTGVGAEGGAQSVVEELTIDSIDVSAGGMFEFSLGSTVIEDFTVDTSRGALMAKLDPLVLAATTGVDPDPQDLFELVLDAYGAFGVGRYSLTDVAARGPEFSAALGEFAIEGLSALGLDRFALTGLEVEAPGTSVSVGGVELSDYTFPDRDVVLSAGFAAMLGGPPSPRLIMDVIPTLGAIAVRDVTAVVAGSDAPFRLERFVLTLGDYIPPIPTEIELDIAGLEVPAGLLRDPGMAAMLEAMGATPLRADATIALRWDEDSQRFELIEDIDVADVARLEANATLSGIPRVVFEDPTRAQEALATAALNGLTARITNQGAADFAIGMMSQQTGVPAAEFASVMATQVQMQVAMITGSQEFADEVATAVRTFLADPQSLTVSAAPAAPVPLAQLIGAAMTAPQLIPGIVNFAIRANE